MARTKHGSQASQWRIADSLPYLINRVGFRIIDQFGQALTREKITVSMWRVLAILKSNGRQRISDLAEPSSLDSSTLSRLLKQLEGRQFVARRRTLSDERVVEVTLTDEGLRLVERVMPTVRHLEDDLAADLSNTEIRMLRDVLPRMYRALGRRSPPSATRTDAPAAKG